MKEYVTIYNHISLIHAIFFFVFTVGQTFALFPFKKKNSGLFFFPCNTTF